MNYLYCVWCALALTACSLECFRVLQSASYRPARGYFKVFYTPWYCILLFATAFSLLWWAFFSTEAILCGGYTLLALPIVCVKRKCPLKFTKRIWRMLVAQFLLLCAACYIRLYWWAPLLPLFVLASWGLCLPVDCVISKKYLRKAQRKLQNPPLTVIAITGSYGKTSTKDMLVALLCDSVAPSGSCNTPLGIAAYVNRTDFHGAKYLVLEFGARKKGDIAQLCKLYHPKYGIVTGVCEQHLATFKTLQNILATKGELTANLPANGVCLLGSDSVLPLQCVGSCKKLRSGVKISDLSVSACGIDFVASRGRERFSVSLPHITPYTADTFALCATLCIRLGQSLEKCVHNAAFVRQTPHRMECKHNGEFYIIDDSYNASIQGVRQCADLLAKLSGQKVCISQGIVEGGADKRELNVSCGQLLGDVCDALILLGKNAKLLQLGAEKSKCRVVKRAKNLQHAVELAQPYLVEGSFLLFQNDLPDVVNI